jgi:hypothetical protein
MRWLRFDRRLIANAPRAFGRALVLACLILSGCSGWIVPVPLPQSAGPVATSRANVDEKTPDRIVANQTTRTQVLLTLGEPDGRGLDDRWFTYGTVARRGGIKWVNSMTVLNEPNVSQRLLIRFDPQGIVSSVEFSQNICTEELHNCLEAAGGDLLAVEQAQIDASGVVLAEYNPVSLKWRSSRTCSLRAKSEYDAGYGDAFVVTERAVFWRDRRSAPRWRMLPVGDVEDAPSVQDDGVWEWIPVRQRNGSCLFFEVGMFADPNGLSEAQHLRSFFVAWIAHNAAQQGSP